MIAFELLINGKRVATAGAEDLSVLSQTITARGKLGAASGGTSNVRDRVVLEAALTGLTSRSSEPANVHQVWYHGAIGVGDEITIRVVERSSADVPRSLPHAAG